jgi:WhiB family redox-sensing transcriptional regulator
VRIACLTYALDSREKQGVWGGASARERRKMLRTRRIA